MATINCEQLFKNKLDKLWQNASQSLPLSRGYAIEREVEKESLLFIGMNPSFKYGAWNNGNQGGSIFYDIPSISEKINTNNFFNAINDFYVSINCANKPKLAHHDLLFVRQTKQKSVLEIQNTQKAFFKKQLDISKRIIELSEPVLIVVLNAGASDLFKKLFGNGTFDNKLGAFMYNINGKDTPVPFSGMLTGQRALDLGTKLSLKWHIEFILKQIP